MGKWVILVGGPEFGLHTIRAMTFEGKTSTRDYGEKQFDVLFGGGYVSFQSDYCGMIKKDYSPECLKSLPFDAPQFILLKYSERSLLENVISSKEFPENVFIDCDGIDLGLEQFINKSRLLYWC